ncbi:MAG: hypothetical protein RLY31_2899 [Bacteroidota bacterium]|jgi:hypothetical protein
MVCNPDPVIVRPMESPFQSGKKAPDLLKKAGGTLYLVESRPTDMITRSKLLAFLLNIGMAGTNTYILLVSGDWNDPVIWSPAGMPAAGDIPLFHNSGRVQFKVSFGQPLCIPIAEPYGQITPPKQTCRDAVGLAIKNLPAATIPPREAGSKILVKKKVKNLQSASNQ